MSHFDLHIRFPAGGPLIGGYAPVSEGIHQAHARDGQGRAYIPSTALRGALRESIEALLRGAGQGACSGGDGVEPDPSYLPGAVDDLNDGDIAPERVPRPCTLGPDGAPCLACQLFGTRRNHLKPDELAFSALVVGDAVPTTEVDWTVRPGVSVQRNSRSAEEKRLYFQQIPQTSTRAPLEFVARGRLLQAGLISTLEAAVRATTHVGAGRSRGLAHVEMWLTWKPGHGQHQARKDRNQERSHARPGDEPRGVSQAKLPGTGDVLMRATLTAPALIGTAIVDQNFRETRYEVPGSAVRGAVGFCLAELLGEQAGDDSGLSALVDEQHGAQFGFLYPTDQEAGYPVGPLPITALECKHKGREHCLFDSLLDRLVMLHAGDADEAERAATGAVTQCPEPDCNAPLRTARGSRKARKKPRRRMVTRVSMDRTRSAAADGELFTQILMDAGTVLEGTIRNIPEGGRARLAQALSSGIVSFGRGRASGWGQAEFTVQAAPAPATMDERARAFDQALERRLRAMKLSTERVGTLVPVTLLSPLWLPGRGDGEQKQGDQKNGESLIARALGAESYFLKARRFARDGAWDQRRGAMQSCWTIAAGAVFVVELAGKTWRDVEKGLQDLEREGVGERRHQGYGQVICFDPHIIDKAGNS